MRIVDLLSRCGYLYKIALNGDVTVATWKRTRFFVNDPVFDDGEFLVVVLDGANGECAGHRKLRSSRDSYRE